jgi:hypothetical protein
MHPVICPLCGNRRARRGCPALDKQICAICCGTKRQVEIACPADCAYLASAREHPAAALVRQQQRDVAMLVQFVRDFSERQSQLFFLIGTFLVGYRAPELQPSIDDDVAEGMTALAATFETASRGVIYEHRPATLAAERLLAAAKPVLAEAGRGLGSAFERDVAVVLRRVGEAAREMRASSPDNRRAFLDLLGRMIKEPSATETSRGDEAAGPPSTSRLIVP